jgi:4a-hydroxytetrahydrobiopterin dehydratase
MPAENKTILDEAGIASALEGLPGWRREGIALAAEWRFESFTRLMPFLRRVLDTMDRCHHHADLVLDSRTRTLTVRVTTHSAGAVTRADVDFARTLMLRENASPGSPLPGA